MSRTVDDKLRDAHLALKRKDKVLAEIKGQIGAVLELHSAFENPKWESNWCSACSSPGDDWFVSWPCNTVELLKRK